MLSLPNNFLGSGRVDIINTHTTINHDCVIRDHSYIAPVVTLFEDVCVGEIVNIGVGTTVIQGINIGMNSIVAEGVIVFKSVEPGKTVIH
jgi:acetyltransferase-like isoleucine patch superfamily enzyme